MEWKKAAPDAFPGESEYDYDQRKREESDAAVGLGASILNIFVLILRMAALFGIFLYAGFLGALKVLDDDAGKFKIWVLALLLTYLIFCVIYLFKGITIGFRTRKSFFWMLPWLMCVIICCLIPAIIVKAAVSAMFSINNRGTAFYYIATWGAFILFALYTYGIYKFKTNYAPNIFRWSYILGLKMSL